MAQESLGDSELVLHFFERDAFRLWIERANDDELHDHHHRKKDKGIRAAGMRDDREDERDRAVHEPVREAAEALSFSTHLIGEDFADVNPDDRAL